MNTEEKDKPESHRLAEIVAQIEQLDSIPDIEKVHILLIANGKKPAGIVDLYFEPGHEEYSEEDYQHDIQALRSILEELEMTCHVETSTGELPHATTFTIAKDSEHLDSLEKARQLKDEEGDIAVGRALGYPETAVQALAKGKAFVLTEIPESVSDNVAVKFLGFRMSRDQWQEEIEVGRQRAQAIKEIAPSLYDKIISQD